MGCCSTTTIIVFSVIGVFLVFLMGFGVAGYYEWSEEKCKVCGCTDFNIDGVTGAQICINLTKWDATNVWQASTVYDKVGSSCDSINNDQIEKCYYNSYYHIISNIRYPNWMWFMMLFLIGFIIFIIIMAVMYSDKCG